jgi:hypothetical protein
LKNSLQAAKAHEIRKMKSRLILEALVLPCSPNKKEAMLMKKHAKKELTPSSLSGNPSCHAIRPPPKKALYFLALDRRAPRREVE